MLTNSKYKVSSGIIDPSTSGIYATCARHREKNCQKELSLLFDDKFKEYYKDADLEEEEDEEELSIEDAIKKELQELQQTKENVKKEPFQFIDLGCECVVFCKTRKPVDPVDFVEKLCQESFESKIKTTRYTQKLTPITFSVSASVEELTKLAQKVLKPHFHKEEGQEPVTFAIKVSSRNFNTIDKMDIIKKVAECVGRDHGHKVDLKKYQKLILVECFKNNIGMSVVDNYDKYQKFNLQQIFEKQTSEKKDDEAEKQVKAPEEVAKEKNQPPSEVSPSKEEQKDTKLEDTTGQITVDV